VGLFGEGRNDDQSALLRKFISSGIKENNKDLMIIAYYEGRYEYLEKY